MATHSSILAWRISWMEKPGRTQLSNFTFTDVSEGKNVNKYGTYLYNI